MYTNKQKGKQVRVLDEDYKLLHSLKQQRGESMTKVIHQVLEERPRLGPNNQAFLEREALRTGKTMWQVLDRIVFEHQVNELFRKRSERLLEREHDEDYAQLTQAMDENLEDIWADL
ncbi:MAG TPA: hypothetical protein V6D17_23200 [Candidatus Obscuribacterales bacterium]